MDLINTTKYEMDSVFRRCLLSPCSMDSFRHLHSMPVNNHTGEV